MHTLVLKFGGTSVATAESWQMIGEIIKDRCQQHERLVVVVSALSQVSNKLEQILRSSPDTRLTAHFTDLAAQHHRLATELGIADQTFIATYLDELRTLLADLGTSVSPLLWAKVMSYGEIISSLIAYRFLQTLLQPQHLNTTWLAAANLLLAQEDNHLNTPCIYRPKDKERDLLQTSGLLITQGFIARNSDDQIVLLGRGGSDTSATLLAAGLSAVRCELWSDVPGFYTADPHQVSEAKLIKDLHYKEAQELALMGAKVLHHRAIAPPYQAKHYLGDALNTRQACQGGQKFPACQRLPLHESRQSQSRNISCFYTWKASRCGDNLVFWRIYSPALSIIIFPLI